MVRGTRVNFGCYRVRIYGSCKPGILATVLRVAACQSTAMLLREIRWPEEGMQMNTVRAVPERWRAKWITSGARSRWNEKPGLTRSATSGGQMYSGARDN